MSTAGDTSKAYIDARWEVAATDQLFLAIGVGAAIHDGKLGRESEDRKALGSRVLFHLPAEVGWRFDAHHGVSIFFDHMSNAGLADLNEGMDTLGIRYAYRF
ncbi:MAG: acyloxyacyl hydrolase [Trueperaceae bacterium]|nr:acyloxyacyl hydrolase [Trueperaceae bacterium]